jgi:hypothetical protein
MTLRKGIGALVLAIMLATASWLAAQDAEKKSAALSAASLQTVLEQREKASWDAYKNKDRKAYEALLSDDFTAVLADGKGEHSRQAVIDSMNEITIHSYTLSDFKITRLGPDVALLRYTAATNVTFGGGKPMDAKLAVGDIWVRRGGVWKSLRYQETEVK